jgi:4-amino-4-deoxychorismate lyase
MNNIDSKSNTAFKFGFGFFETLRAINSKLIFFDEHIERLNHSLKVFNLPLVDKDEIKEKILKELSSQKFNDSRIRITYSIQNDKPLITIDISKFVRTFPEEVKLTISKFKLLHNDELRKHKTTNYFLQYFEYQNALKNGFDEVLFIDHMNHILEGSRTNIFLIYYERNFRGIKIYTPELNCGVLNGIARSKVIQICKNLGHPIIEKKIDLKELRMAKEIFLTNSINGVIPVKKNKSKSNSPITKIIQQEFNKFFEA